jgi:hypothetical protein
LLATWPSQLLGEVPIHLLPDLAAAEWIGLYPPEHRQDPSRRKSTIAILKELAQDEFEEAFLVHDGTDRESHTVLVSRALKFRLAALRLVQWAKQQLAGLRDAVCPRIHLGDMVDTRTFRVSVAMAGFTRTSKLPDKQAALLAELLTEKGSSVKVTKQRIHELRKRLPELGPFFEKNGDSQYSLDPQVCNRAKLALRWRKTRLAS